MTDTASKDEMLSNIAKEINSCKKCPLHLTRNIPLVGEGRSTSNIMIIGESPGYHENRTGKAFIGKSGKILDQLLAHVHLSRKDVYITNILKCHPPRNHDPKPGEIHDCLDYLDRQIKIIQPTIIMTLGRFASKAIFSKESLPFSKIREMHGKIFEIKASYGRVKILPHYHPATACYATTGSCNISTFDTLKQDFKKTIGKLLT